MATSSKARDRRRLAGLIGMMGVIVMFSGGVSMYLLYDAAVTSQLARMRDAARNQARLIEAVARHDATDASIIGEPADHTLTQVIDAHERSEGFGETGEFVLARREGDQIVFVLSHRHGEPGAARPAPLPLDGGLALPMRRALLGESGSSLGTDYRGERVLAGFEPVAELEMGLVAKIDLAEIRAPYVRAALYGGGVGILAIIVSALLFVRATRPLARRAERSEAFNRAIVESAADGIVIVDGAGVVRDLNPAGQRIFGYSSAEAIGLELAQLIPSLQIADHATNDGVVLGVHANGADIPVEVSVSALPTRESPRYSLFVRDVSERQRLEAELRHAHKMEAIGTLASGIAHDFNNLLMGVTGSASVALKSCPPDSPAHRHLAEIRSAAVGGASITRQLLDFGRRGETAPTGIDVNSVVAGAEAMLRRIVGTDVELRVTLSGSQAHILGDRGELEQILLNLAGNARHAMPSGGTLALATNDATLDGGDYVLLAVSDTGVGMTEETKARIFEPFFTTKEPGSGTGLGLASTYAIVRRNGGHIEVDSAVGKGTTFRIFWPKADGELEAAPDISLDGLRGDETIMLVEDEPLVRQTIAHYLERSGYRVIDAPDADHALARLADRDVSVDLLLTDIVLPGKPGTELAAAMLELIPGLRVVFMSAYPTAKLHRDGHIDAGTETLQKPFTELSLLTHVRSVLGDAPPRAPVDERPAPRSTLLFVEDHAVSRDTCYELLTDLGYTVLPAASGTEALDVARAHPGAIDLVISDLGLPDMTCEELFDDLGDTVADGPFLLISGRSAHDSEVVRLLERPRSAYVEKPIDFDLVVEKIEALLATRTSA